MGIKIAGGDYLGFCPIGAILPFLKSFGAGLTVPLGWQECDGSAITAGTFAGSNTPDLNSTKSFLRGGVGSGGVGGTDTHNHGGSTGLPNATVAVNTVGLGAAGADRHSHSISNVSHLPTYYGVVFIMRIF